MIASFLGAGLPWSLVIAMVGVWTWLTAHAARRCGRAATAASALLLIAVLVVVALQMLPPAAVRQHPTASEEFTKWFVRGDDATTVSIAWGVVTIAVMIAIESVLVVRGTRRGGCGGK